MVKIERTEPLESPVSCAGTIVGESIRDVSDKASGDSWEYLRVEIALTSGVLMDVIGLKKTSVDFPLGNFNEKSLLGRLALAAGIWKPDEEFESDGLIGCPVQFNMVENETPAGSYWNVDRRTVEYIRQSSKQSQLV